MAPVAIGSAIGSTEEDIEAPSDPEPLDAGIEAESNADTSNAVLVAEAADDASNVSLVDTRPEPEPTQEMSQSEWAAFDGVENRTSFRTPS